MSEKNLPVEISFSNEDRQAIGKRPTPVLGKFMRFRTVEATTSESEKGHLMIQETVVPVDADGNLVRSLQVRNILILPKKNTDWEARTGKTHEFKGKDGKAYDPFQGCYQRLTAGDKALPRYPRRVPETKEYIDSVTGEVVQNVGERREQVKDAVLAKLARAWRDPDLLVGEEFYACLKQNGNYLNLEKITGNTPDEPVVTTEFFTGNSEAQAA